MAKVYCKECEYYQERINLLAIKPVSHTCKSEYTVEHTPLELIKIFPECCTKNKGNDCSDFEVKRIRRYFGLLKGW